MKKLIVLLMVTSTSLHATATSPQKVRAYAKIAYGLTALALGIASPIMSGYHMVAGKILAEVSDGIENANETIQQRVQNRPIFGKIVSVTQKPLKGTERVIDSQADLQYFSGGLHLANTFFLIPLGVAAIQSGREDLKRIANLQDGQEREAHTDIE